MASNTGTIGSADNNNNSLITTPFENESIDSTGVGFNSTTINNSNSLSFQSSQVIPMTKIDSSLLTYSSNNVTASPKSLLILGSSFKTESPFQVVSAEVIPTYTDVNRESVLTTSLSQLKTITTSQNRDVFDSVSVNDPLIMDDGYIVICYQDIYGNEYDKENIFTLSNGQLFSLAYYNDSSYVPVKDVDYTIFKLNKKLSKTTYYTYLFNDEIHNEISYRHYIGNIEMIGGIPYGTDIPYYSGLVRTETVNPESIKICTYKNSCRDSYGNIVLKEIQIPELRIENNKVYPYQTRIDFLDKSYIEGNEIYTNEVDITEFFKNNIISYSLNSPLQYISKHHTVNLETNKVENDTYLLIKEHSLFKPVYVYTYFTNNIYEYVPYSVFDVSSEYVIECTINTNIIIFRLITHDGTKEIEIAFDTDNNLEYVFKITNNIIDKHTLNGIDFYKIGNFGLSNYEFYFSISSIIQDEQYNWIECNKPFLSTIENTIVNVLTISNSGNYLTKINIKKSSNNVYSGISSLYNKQEVKVYDVYESGVNNFSYIDYLKQMSTTYNLEYVDYLENISYYSFDETLSSIKYKKDVLYEREGIMTNYVYYSPQFSSYVNYENVVLEYNNNLYGSSIFDNDNSYKYKIVDVYERTKIKPNEEITLSNVENSKSYLSNNSEAKINTYIIEPTIFSNDFDYEFDDYSFVEPIKSYVINYIDTKKAYTYSSIITRDGYWKRNFKKNIKPLITLTYSYASNSIDISNAYIVPTVKNERLGFIHNNKITYNDFVEKTFEDYKYVYYDSYNVQKIFSENSYNKIINVGDKFFGLTTPENITLGNVLPSMLTTTITVIRSSNYNDEIVNNDAYYKNFYKLFSNGSYKISNFINLDNKYHSGVSMASNDETNTYVYIYSKSSNFLAYVNNYEENQTLDFYIQNGEKNLLTYTCGNTELKEIYQRMFINKQNVLEEYVIQEDELVPQYAHIDTPFGLVNGKKVIVTDQIYVPESYTTIVTIDPETYEYVTKRVLQHDAYMAYSYEIEDIPLITSTYIYDGGDNGIKIKGMDDLIQSLNNLTIVSANSNQSAYNTVVIPELSYAIANAYDGYSSKSYYSRIIGSYLYSASRSLVYINEAIDRNTKTLANSISSIDISRNDSSYFHDIANSISLMSNSSITTSTNNVSNLINAQKNMVSRITDSINNQTTTLSKILAFGTSSYVSTTGSSSNILSSLTSSVSKNWQSVTKIGYQTTEKITNISYKATPNKNSKVITKTPLLSYTKTVIRENEYDQPSYVSLSYVKAFDSNISSAERIGLHLSKDTREFAYNGYIYKEDYFSYKNIADILSELKISHRMPTRKEFIIDVSKKLYINSDFIFAYTSANEYAIRAIRRADILWKELENANIVDVVEDVVRPLPNVDVKFTMSPISYQISMANKLV